MLVVSDRSTEPLYVTGPVVAGAATRTGLYRPGAPARSASPWPVMRWRPSPGSA